MSIESTKRLVQSGFGIWLASLASVAMAVAACVIWLDRPIALLAYELFGRHRAVQHLAGTPGSAMPRLDVSAGIEGARGSGLEARHRHLYAPEGGCHGSKGEIGSDAVP
jgi:hypothetical protein